MGIKYKEVELNKYEIKFNVKWEREDGYSAKERFERIQVTKISAKNIAEAEMHLKLRQHSRANILEITCIGKTTIEVPYESNF